MVVKVGDLVRKQQGNDKGEVGIVVDLTVNKMDNSENPRTVTIATVSLNGEVKVWYAEYLEVIGCE